MRHAAHKAAKVSHAQFSLSKALFTANRGSHTAKAVRMAQLAEGGAVVGLAPEVVDKLNEVAPMSRRAMREAAKAASRKSALVTSASLAALVGTAATALAFSQQNASRLVLADDGTETSQIKRVSDGAASRSEGRTALKELASTSNNGGWQLGDTSASMDASPVRRSIADHIASCNEVKLPLGKQGGKAREVIRHGDVHGYVIREKKNVGIICHGHTYDLPAEQPGERALAPGKLIYCKIYLKSARADLAHNALMPRREGVKGAREKRNRAQRRVFKWAEGDFAFGHKAVKVVQHCGLIVKNEPPLPWLGQKRAQLFYYAWKTGAPCSKRHIVVIKEIAA